MVREAEQAERQLDTFIKYEQYTKEAKKTEILD